MLTLTILGPDALDEWADFHAANQSHFVKERDPAKLARAAAASKLFVLRDPSGQIRGSCGCFEYGDQGDFREVGAVRVLDEGWGLQVVLMTAAVVSEWVFDPPPEPILAVTANINSRSIYNIGKANFQNVSTLSRARLQAMGLTGLNPEKVYFEHAITPTLPLGAGLLRQIRAQNGLNKGNRHLVVQLQIPVMEVL